MAAAAGGTADCSIRGAVPPAGDGPDPGTATSKEGAGSVCKDPRTLAHTRISAIPEGGAGTADTVLFSRGRMGTSIGVAVFQSISQVGQVPRLCVDRDRFGVPRLYLAG